MSGLKRFRLNVPVSLALRVLSFLFLGSRGGASAKDKRYALDNNGSVPALQIPCYS